MDRYNKKYKKRLILRMLCINKYSTMSFKINLENKKIQKRNRIANNKRYNHKIKE